MYETTYNPFCVFWMFSGNFCIGVKNNTSSIMGHLTTCFFIENLPNPSDVWLGNQRWMLWTHLLFEKKKQVADVERESVPFGCSGHLPNPIQFLKGTLFVVVWVVEQARQDLVVTKDVGKALRVWRCHSFCCKEICQEWCQQMLASLHPICDAHATHFLYHPK